MNHFLDTTALVAHALDEPGASEVQALMSDEEHDLFISALSLFELAGVLKNNQAADAIPLCWEAYCKCAQVVPVDDAMARSAWELRATSGQRIPMADAIIAASAQSLGAKLVHRDQHLARIAPSLIPQRLLGS